MTSPAHEIVAAMRTLDRKRLNRGASGNISLRCPEAGDGFWITPSGIPATELTVDDIVHVDGRSQVHGRWRASSEWRFHRDVLAARADISALVHTHSIHATAFAICRQPIPAAHYMVAAAGGAEIPCAGYAVFGSQALSESIVTALGARYQACLMANHGMLAGGPSLARALWLAEEVETLAHQYALACQIGRPAILDAAAMNAVQAGFAGYGPGSTTHAEPSE